MASDLNRDNLNDVNTRPAGTSYTPGSTTGNVSRTDDDGGGSGLRRRTQHFQCADGRGAAGFDPHFFKYFLSLANMLFFVRIIILSSING